MDRISEYFLDQRNKKHYLIKLKNRNKKPITFSHLIYDFNFDDFKRDYTYELLKTEVICNNSLKLFKYLIESGSRNISIHNFWCMKKGSSQYIGFSVKQFFSMIKNRKGFTFNYPIINGNYYLIFNGISGDKKTFKLFLYLNNRHFAYIDIISFFKKDIVDLNLNVKIKEIKKIKVASVYKYSLGEYIPKLICTLGYIMENNYCELYYFIKKPRIKKDKFIDKLSHLLVWNNGTPIKYNEKNRFSFCQAEFLELDEISLFSLRASKRTLEIEY